MKILIKGSFGNYNFGDDLLSFAICDYLRKLDHNFKITLLSNNEYLKDLLPNVRVVRFVNNNEIYDILLYAGGTQFASFKKKSFLELYKNRIKHLFTSSPIILFRSVLNKFYRKNKFYKKMVLLGIGIGPFHTKDKYYKSSISLLKNNHLLAVRDVLSEKICLQNSIKHIIGSDLVFSIPDSYWKKLRKIDNHKKRKIAFIIRDWDFDNKNASFIYKLKDFVLHEYDITFISFCKEKDEKCLDILGKGKHRDSIKIWDPINSTFQIFLNDLNEFDMFITARYHGAIISSLLKKPFISIGIEPKLTMVSDLFNMPCWKYPYNIENLKKNIMSLELNNLITIAQIEEISENEKMKAANMMDCFYSLLKHEK